MTNKNNNSYPIQQSSETVRDAILANVDFGREIDPESFEFDPQLGGLVTRDTDERLRMLVFRGHQPTEQSLGDVAVSKLLNRNHNLAHQGNSILGLGTYIGNTPEAVAIFATRPSGREIGVYLTPSFAREDVTRSIQTRAEENPLWYMLQVGLMGLRDRTKKFDEFVQEKNRQFGNSKLVIHDVDRGTRFAHSLQLEQHTHQIPPIWYVWRDSGAPFEKIGTVTKLLDTTRLVKASRVAVRAAQSIKPKSK